MERNSLNNLKDSGRSLRDNFNNNNNNSNKVNDSCDYNNCCFGGDCLGRFSWPPRSYTCSFCKREFRSAQALGGHMNVHRRDRARLRQSPPWDGQFPEVNPNPNLSSSSSHSSRVPSFTYPFPSLLSPSLTCFSSPTFTSSCVVKTSMGPSQSHEPSSSIGGNMKEMKTMKALFGVGELKGYVQEDECRVLKKAEFDRLNLEMGLCRDSKEDLDLELRLGSS